MNWSNTLTALFDHLSPESTTLNPIGLAMLALHSTLDLRFSSAFAQTRVFSYQGRLSVNGNFANGTFDVRSRLITAETGGPQVGSDLTRLDVNITDGVFDVTLDSGVADMALSSIVTRLRETIESDEIANGTSIGTILSMAKFWA